MIIVVIGFTGQGKSTLAAYLAQRCPTRVIFDPRGQFHTAPDVLPDSSEVYELLDEKAELIVQPGRGAEVERAFAHVCYQLANWVEDNPAERVCFVVDEARLAGLESKAVPLDFDWLLRSSREGSPIDIIITCHRPVDVSTNIRAIANRLIFFQVRLPTDLAIIEDQCGPEVADKVRLLLDRQFITWNNSRQQYRLVANPQSWRVTLSSQPTVGYVRE
jgi:hypothetical protein